MKKRGSSLIISVLLIAAIGGIAFSIGRLMFAETKLAAIYENGAVAYYAAESGLEEGFLRYRYNMNTEVPFSNWTLGENKFFRSNLVDKTVNIGVVTTLYQGLLSSTPISDPAKQYYDLRIGYLGTNGLPFYGNDVDSSGTLSDADIKDVNYATGDYSFLQVPRDESLKINLTRLDLSTTNKLRLYTKFISSNMNQAANYCKSLMEIKFIIKNAAGTKEYKSLLSPRDKPLCHSVTTGIAESMLLAATESSVVANTNNHDYYMKLDRLQDVINIDNSGALPSTSDEVLLYLKPLNYDAAIGLTIDVCTADPNSCTTKDKVVPGPFTNVSSIGYYGGVTRKLSADIDRQSGTLYDLYDYVIYDAE